MHCLLGVPIGPEVVLYFQVCRDAELRIQFPERSARLHASVVLQLYPGDASLEHCSSVLKFLVQNSVTVSERTFLVSCKRKPRSFC